MKKKKFISFIGFIFIILSCIFISSCHSNNDKNGSKNDSETKLDTISAKNFYLEDRKAYNYSDVSSFLDTLETGEVFYIVYSYRGVAVTQVK